MDGLPIFRAALEAAGRNPDAENYSMDDLEAARRAIKMVDDFIGRQLGEVPLAQFSARLSKEGQTDG